MAKKRTIEELGSLMTREMMTMMRDDTLSKSQRFDLLTAVMFDTKLENTLLASYANSLKSGWNKLNSERIDKIEGARNRRKEGMRRLRVRGIPQGRVVQRGIPQGRVVQRDGIDNIDNIDNIFPLNPPLGIEGEMPKAISAEELLGEGAEETSAGAAEASGEADGVCEVGAAEVGAEGEDVAEGDAVETIRDAAMEISDRIEASEAFGHMRSNRGKLVRAVCSVLKKNGGAARASETGGKILAGLAAWTASWKGEGWQYAPHRIVDWILDEKWLEPVREKPGARGSSGGSAERDYGEVGVKEIV